MSTIQMVQVLENRNVLGELYKNINSWFRYFVGGRGSFSLKMGLKSIKITKTPLETMTM